MESLQTENKALRQRGEENTTLSHNERNKVELQNKI